MTPFFLTAEMAILINQKVILEHSADEQAGVKDHALLDSALKRPQQSLFGEDAYPTLYEKGAALLESLAQNHAVNVKPKVDQVAHLKVDHPLLRSTWIPRSLVNDNSLRSYRGYELCE